MVDTDTLGGGVGVRINGPVQRNTYYDLISKSRVGQRTVTLEPRRKSYASMK